MINFYEVDMARKVFGLGEDASLDEIKDAYRKLSLKYHPDRCAEEEKIPCEERMKEVNHAKDIVMMYCTGYRFSFREKDVNGWFGGLGL